MRPSRNLSPRLTLEIRPSRRLQCIACMMLATVLAALAFAPGPPWYWRLITAIGVILLAGPPLRELIWLRGPRTIHRIEWSEEGTWRIWRSQGEPLEVDLLPASTVMGPLVFLFWSHAGEKHHHAVIDSSSLAPGPFRALRGRLRLEGARPSRRERRDNC